MDIGKIWTGWKTEEYIGEGSFGKVYRITREDFGHTYESALKVITIPANKGELASVLNDGFDEESATMYFRSMVEDIVDEFALMSKLRGNSNIVSFEDHAVVEHENEIGWDIYIRMELLTPLFQHIRQHPLSVRDVILLGIHICQALEVCQNYNIIHRDIKPENIFISELGQYKLGDFGIARQLEKTSSGLSKKGTYGYMAPEVYKGEEYNATVDIYSLGVVLYRFLNHNRNPFMPPYPNPIRVADKERANMMRFNGSEMEPPCNAQGRLAEIVLKACAFHPKERYENARAMREALQEVLYSEKEADMIYPGGDSLENDVNPYLFSSDKSNESEQEIEILNIDGSEKTRGLFGKKYEENYALEKSRQEEERKKAEEDRQREEERKKAEEEDRQRKETRKKAEEEERQKAEEARKKAEEEKQREEARKKAEKKKKEEEARRKEEEGRKKKEEEQKRKEEKKIREKAKEEAKRKAQEKALKREERKSEVQPKWDRKFLIAGIGILAVIVIGVFLFGSVQKSSQTQVPNFSNMDMAQANATALESRLVLQESQEEYSDTVEKGKIISQNIKAGTVVKKDSAVNVVISKGKSIKVPDVARLDQEAARQKLSEFGLDMKIGEEIYSDTISVGAVISQSPKAGEVVDEKTVILLAVSKGIEQTKVPDVTRLSRKEAKAALTKVKLKVTIEKAYSSEVEEGNVISQSVEAGTDAAVGTEVHLTVSQGPEPAEEPPEPPKSTPAPVKQTDPQPQEPAPSQQDAPQETPPEAPAPSGNEESIDSWDLVN